MYWIYPLALHPVTIADAGWSAHRAVRPLSSFYTVNHYNATRDLFVQNLFTPPRKTILLFAATAALSILLLGGCATKGSGSPSAQPVFYPNATLNRVGEAQARDEAQVCMARAQDAGLTPEEQTNAVARGAGKGAAMGGVAGAVGALVRGRGVERVVESGAAGAAVGGSVGAVGGAFHEKPNQTYRRFVHRCLSDKGFDVIGWN